MFNQPAGLGDILLLMAIAQKYHAEGHTIVWPTAVEFHLHQKNFPEVKFIPQDHFGMYNIYDTKREIYEDDSYKVFPFRWADVILHGKSVLSTCLKDKYDFVGLPLDMWRGYKITRDFETEDKLFKELGLHEGEEYNIINENQTRIYQKTKISVDNGLKNIYMNPIPSYNMLDWMKVIYNAKTVHTVATGLLMVLEKYEDLKSKEKHIYKRIWDSDHSSYDYLMTNNFIFH